MARMSIRIDLDRDRRVGPGKVLLLERIAECGSISAAGRSLNMSYRRAWLLVADLNTSFDQPLVEAQMGGRQGGGATLTELGREMIRRYRTIEHEAQAAVEPHLAAVQAAASKRPAEDKSPASRSIPSDAFDEEHRFRRLTDDNSEE